MGKRNRKRTINYEITQQDNPTYKYTKNVTPKNEKQRTFLNGIEESDVSVVVGPAGTGKTYLAVCKALDYLDENKVQKIILTRPAVDAGENIGFLPGGIEDKLAPYLRPLYDIILERKGSKFLKEKMDQGIIEIAPVGYMRGRTLNNSIIIIDEAQNCTEKQLKMLMTRMGFHSKMIITGDPDQVDDVETGLETLFNRIQLIDDSRIFSLKYEKKDIIRHPVITKILDLFEGTLNKEGDILENIRKEKHIA